MGRRPDPVTPTPPPIRYLPPTHPETDLSDFLLDEYAYLMRQFFSSWLLCLFVIKPGVIWWCSCQKASKGGLAAMGISPGAGIWVFVCCLLCGPTRLGGVWIFRSSRHICSKSFAPEVIHTIHEEAACQSSAGAGKSSSAWRCVPTPDTLFVHP